MIIAGANIGSTQCGKALRDGGAAIVSDGELVFALAEETITSLMRRLRFTPLASAKAWLS